MNRTLLPILMAFAHAATAQSSSPHAHHHHRHVHADMKEHWMAPAKEAKRKNPVRPTPASIMRGEGLFHEHCASCHGTEARGDGPAGAMLTPGPTNLREMAPLHSDGDLAWKIAHGRGPMPAWKTTLKSTQIWDLVNYLRQMR